MAEKITNNAIILWQIQREGVGEPALLIRRYTGGMIGIQQEDRSEVLINESSFPVLIKIMRHLGVSTDFEGIKLP